MFCPDQRILLFVHFTIRTELPRSNSSGKLLKAPGLAAVRGLTLAPRAASNQQGAGKRGFAKAVASSSPLPWPVSPTPPLVPFVFPLPSHPFTLLPFRILLYLYIIFRP